MSYRVLLAALLVVLAFPADVAAQDNGKRWRLWSGLGFGGGGTSSNDGAGLMIELVYQKQPHHAGVRVLGLLDVYGSSGSISEIDVLYGRVVTGRVGHASLATGLAYTDGDLCAGSGQCRNGATIGVPLVAEVALRPLPVLGLGIQAFGNFNSKAHLGGAFVFLQLGWLP